MITAAQQEAQRNRGTIFVEAGEVLSHESFPGDQHIMRLRAAKCAATARAGRLTVAPARLDRQDFLAACCGWEMGVEIHSESSLTVAASGCQGIGDREK